MTLNTNALYINILINKLLMNFSFNLVLNMLHYAQFIENSDINIIIELIKLKYICKNTDNAVYLF